MLVEVDRRRIEFARPEKWVWYPERYTMLDLAKYYVAVSPWLLPHLECRPLVYEIYKGTIEGPNSFEQDPPAGTPRWVKRAQIQGRARLVTYVVADSAATLVYLVSLFMVTLHVWQSTTRAIEKPDFLLLDLDPVGDCTISRMARGACTSWCRSCRNSNSTACARSPNVWPANWRPDIRSSLRPTRTSKSGRRERCTSTRARWGAE